MKDIYIYIYEKSIREILVMTMGVLVLVGKDYIKGPYGTMMRLQKSCRGAE